MFHDTKQLEAAVWRAFDAKSLRRFRPLPHSTARGEHARMLDIAAARRLRAVERLAEARADDADYWKAVAPSAIGKARAVRREAGFTGLP